MLYKWQDSGVLLLFCFLFFLFFPITSLLSQPKKDIFEAKLTILKAYWIYKMDHLLDNSFGQ